MHPFLTLGGLVLGAAIVGAVVCPWLVPLVAFPIERIFRRVFMVLVLGGTWWWWRRLGARVLGRVGTERFPGWGLHWAAGIVLGVVSLSVLLVLTVVCGANEWHVSRTAARMAVKLAAALATGVLVGTVEELFFRGVVLGLCLRDLPRVPAVLCTSVLYALVHFLDAPAALTVEGIQPWVGFRVLANHLAPLVEVSGHVVSFVSLILVGVVLACAYLRTGALWVSIGLHTGWVTFLKADHLFVKMRSGGPSWLFGGGEILSGVATWVAVLLVSGVVELLMSRGFLRRPVAAPRVHRTLA